MLVLSRKVGEQIVIGDNVVVIVTDILRGRVKLGFVAPDDVPIHRREVYDAIKRENRECPRANRTVQANRTTRG
ncbi:hypothetical protein LCGC14_0772350 [marine sediment metagenome]|uniref:Carbon storage regulator n=1 Tax=marine sediment metagenome TaxID=412755 RepID=A0A0F9PY36_9ZZZZ